MFGETINVMRLVASGVSMGFTIMYFLSYYVWKSSCCFTWHTKSSYYKLVKQLFYDLYIDLSGLVCV